MDYYKDFIYLTRSSGKKTFRSLKKHWPLIFTGFIYSLLNIALFGLMGMLMRGPFYLLSGIILAIANSSLVSNYLYLLFNIINYDRMTVQDFKDGFIYYLRKIYGIFFIAYIGRLILSLLGPVLGGLVNLLDVIIYFTILVLLNPLPETIYQKHYDSWESIVYSVEFIQENWLNWLVPNFLLSLILYFTTGIFLTDVFTTHLGFSNLINPINIALYIVGQLVFSFMMIYRGHLYKELSTSTRRKRMFQNKF